MWQEGDNRAEDAFGEPRELVLQAGCPPSPLFTGSWLGVTSCFKFMSESCHGPLDPQRKEPTWKEHCRTFKGKTAMTAADRSWDRWEEAWVRPGTWEEREEGRD